jgi:hypothetical protein
LDETHLHHNDPTTPLPGDDVPAAQSAKRYRELCAHRSVRFSGAEIESRGAVYGHDRGPVINDPSGQLSDFAVWLTTRPRTQQGIHDDGRTRPLFLYRELLHQA